MHPRRRATAIVAAMVAAAGLGVSSAVALPTTTADPQPGDVLPRAVPAAGTFYPTTVTRLLGSNDGGYAVEPGTGATIAVAGHAGLPSSGISAVVVNVTGVAGPADAALSFAAFGTPAPPPLLVAPAGTTRSALLTLPLGSADSIAVTTTASAAVAADLVGFYAADDTVVGSHGVSGGYQPVDVTRVFDSDSGQPLAAGGRQVLGIDLGTAATPHTTALLVRATVKGAQAAGTLTVGSSVGATPSVPFVAAAPASNLAVVPASADADGRLDVAVTNASTGATGVSVDLVGFYDDGALGPNLRFRPLPQTRVVDTASGLGAGALEPGRRTTVTPSESVVGDSTFGLVGVATTTSTGGPAAVNVDSPDATPTTAAVDVPASPTSVPVQTPVSAARGVALQSRAGSARTGVTLDITGSFEAYPPVTNPAARGWVSPVSGWQVSATKR